MHNQILPKLKKALANRASVFQNLLARPQFHWPVGQRGFGIPDSNTNLHRRILFYFIIKMLLKCINHSITISRIYESIFLYLLFYQFNNKKKVLIISYFIFKKLYSHDRHIVIVIEPNFFILINDTKMFNYDYDMIVFASWERIPKNVYSVLL